MENFADLKKFENRESLKRDLENRGIIFSDGLTGQEITHAEKKFKFNFPPDLKMFLQHALPIARKERDESFFPDWRHLNSDSLNFYMGLPLEGILFDVENNNFWLPELEQKPQDSEKAKKIMIEAVNKAPKLIPIYAHRYLPAEPLEENNPIFSVHQTDIIYYGSYLYDYFQVEFNKRVYASSGVKPKKIKFWSAIIESNTGRSESMLAP
ncbi:MAG: SMI1/KNR4 family protein [Candidatus Magasanikbacteria bacterium]|nr:SMI1/KNR4 family protein [Candidatus Magasanikbacteria bacterium]